MICIDHWGLSRVEGLPRRKCGHFGGMAQLVARLHGMQKVTGSSPVTSTDETEGPGLRVPAPPSSSVHGTPCQGTQC